jgi:hypothetical protein
VRNSVGPGARFNVKARNFPSGQLFKGRRRHGHGRSKAVHEGTAHLSSHWDGRDLCRSTFYEGSPLNYRIVGIVLAVAVIEALRLDDNWGMDGKFTKGFKQTDFGKTDSL